MRQFIKDNWEETCCGLLLGLGFWWKLGYWCFLLGLFTGILWRLGGSGLWGTKGWRRLGISVLLAIVIPNLTFTLKAVSGLVTFGLLTIGYGSRSTQPPDSGSPLGNFWLDRLGVNLGKLAARLTILISIWITWGATWILSTK